MRLQCLCCGAVRLISDRGHRVDAGECPQCGYVGWTRKAEISEPTRQAVSQRLLKLRAA